jgi:hypothetical protein
MGAETNINDGPGMLTRLRHELEGLKSNVALLRLGRLLSKYESSQPRVPAGQPGGGQWTSGTGTGGERNIVVAGKPISPAQAEFCEQMHKRDLFQCRIVRLRTCYEQAYLRVTNCANGRQIPPLNY